LFFSPHLYFTFTTTHRKLKLHELFVQWLVKPDNTTWLMALLDDVRAGDDTALLAAVAAAHPQSTSATASSGASPATPGSPVSRLLHSQLPFGGSPRPLRLSGSFGGVSTPTPGTSDLDLGRSLVDQAAPTPAASPALAPLPASDTIATAITPEPVTAIDDVAERLIATTAASPLGSPVKANGKTASVDNQVLQRRALDSVADGIAGMKADASSSPADMDDLVDRAPPTAIVDTRSSLAGPSTSPQTPSHVPPPLLASSVDATVPQFDNVFESTSLAKASALTEGDGTIPFSSIVDDMMDVDAAPSTSSFMAVAAVTAAATVDTAVDAAGTAALAKVPAAAAPPPPAHIDAPPISASLPPRLENREDVQMQTEGQLRNARIPSFYFPRGKDVVEREEREWEEIGVLFGKFRETKGGVEGVTRSELDEIVVRCVALPRFFAPLIFDRIIATPSTGLIDLDMDSSHAAQSAGQDSGAGNCNSQNSSMMATAPPSITTEDDDTTMQYAPDGVGDNEASVGEHQLSSANTSTSLAIGANGNRHTSDAAGGAMLVDATASGADAGVTPPPIGAGLLLTEARFREYYIKEVRGLSREERLFYTLRELGAEREHLISSDFKPLLRALLMCHQGLAFLHATPEFQLRYSETVIERIYFSCTRKHNGHLTLEDIRRSRLLDTFVMVDEEEDINRERQYFSYEHFYVLYCRFWELDTDHDLQIDREDLMRYGGHSLTYRIVDRIFGGYARRLDNAEHPGYMSYTDFIWFCLSEEDKNSPTAIDYWYRCIDMDGDGLITMFDMEFFYKEQLHRMECFGHEPVQIRDILCQLLDMVKPNSNPPQVTRQSLKNSSLSSSFYNVLFNLNKFFALEARDPIQIRQEHATPELTDWDRFAALEYLRLSAEEEGEEDESWDNNPLIVGEAPF
jgi:Ca2+-binding EF-hand superfamily protein